MTYSILTTKLFIPPLRADRLPRQRLVERLNESAVYPLTLISASAGSGKTTILTDWIAQNGRPTAWISLDSGDNDPTQFLVYFISALRTISTEFGDAILEMLQSSQTQSLEVPLVNLLNEITGFFEDFTLVCDDFHLITDQKTNELITFLIDHLPPQMHLIIASRIDPPWPLARYRARNQLYELRDQDLRFNFAEADEFLDRTMGLSLSSSEVKALEKRTEGWVAGLQLAGLSLQGRDDVSAFVKAFTGSHVYVAEYLVEEVLQRQPKDIQAFLLQTSLLKRMNAGLCEAVSDCQDGQAILQSLHRENIFVIPLDHEGNWFRYHHLFADLLRARLQHNQSAEEIVGLQLRAADWLERHGFLPEAVNYALTAKNFERVAELVRQAAHMLMFTGRVNILKDWLEALPEESFRAHPQLTFYQFWIDVLQTKADLSEVALREKEELLKSLPSSPENDRLRGELMSVICRAIALSGRTSEGIRLAKEALAYLPADDLASRARANSALAAAHDLEGRVKEAEPAYQDSYSQAIAAGDYRLAAHTLMAKGLIQIHYGYLHEAAKTFQTIVDMAPADPAWMDSAKNVKSSKVFLPAGQGYIGLGCIHLEWNDLDAAENYLERGMDLCRQGGLDGIFIGRVRMSRLRQARGDLEGALEEIQLPEQAQRVDDFNVAIRQIQINLARGDVDGAWRRAAPLAGMFSSDSVSKPPVIFLETIEAVIARVYLARGEIEKALQLVEALQVTAEPGGRLSRLIEVHLLKALAHVKQNMGSVTPESIKNIGHALELGESQGYVTLFLEEGPSLIPLLKAVLDHQNAPDRIKKYARKLLDAFDRIGTSTKLRSISEADGLVEQLTPREMEVLELLAVGDSNQTIADKLVITVRTVKKHTGNIYGKLGASSRIQAVTRARELGLLSTD